MPVGGKPRPRQICRLDLTLPRHTCGLVQSALTSIKKIIRYSRLDFKTLLTLWVKLHRQTIAQVEYYTLERCELKEQMVLGKVTISKHYWMVDVVDDLISYAKAEDLTEIENSLNELRSAVVVQGMNQLSIEAVAILDEPESNSANTRFVS